MDAIILKKIGKDFCFVCIYVHIVLGSACDFGFEVRLSVKTVISKLFDFYQKPPKKSIDNILGRRKGNIYSGSSGIQGCIFFCLTPLPGGGGTQIWPNNMLRKKNY